ncbi:MAG: hypothetical protein EAZ39_13365 [Oscillatoriales cyanobacterium]|nr:MAG: hypothetical protein EAZ45_00270 [Oscillatoriales cyanobacterium]TAG17511.1 MAG: hypothetical protein EAZ39_13365 [Oscillatoriales cyanobacterium]TAG45608.1 MAG: hypothetical protein EAZ33_06935 [Oscillatoriales cyanobacterium]
MHSDCTVARVRQLDGKNEYPQRLAVNDNECDSTVRSFAFGAGTGALALLASWQRIDRTLIFYPRRYL